MAVNERSGAVRRALLPVGLVVGASLFTSGALLLALRDDGTCVTSTPPSGESPAFERVKRLFVRPTPPPAAVAGGMMAPVMPPPSAPASVVGPPPAPTVAGPARPPSSAR
ncbi:MAG: hypothetical protein HOO96_32950 [Polyangiaceae bacterium]|nr:hypothetical protein [Polyangiaceae bacterium]